MKIAICHYSFHRLWKQGDVDIPACIKHILAAGYQGYMALEYEGPEDERTGVPESIAYMKTLV